MGKHCLIIVFYVNVNSRDDIVFTNGKDLKGYG